MHKASFYEAPRYNNKRRGGYNKKKPQYKHKYTYNRYEEEKENCPVFHNTNAKGNSRTKMNPNSSAYVPQVKSDMDDFKISSMSSEKSAQKLNPNSTAFTPSMPFDQFAEEGPSENDMNA